MNQADQRSIIHFISACLDCSNDMVGAGRLLVLILFIYFSARYFAVPDAWRLRVGPRLAYCCG